MIINCLLENINHNVLDLYNPNTKESFQIKVSEVEAENLQELLKETEQESLNTEEFDEPALAIVGYDTSTNTIKEPNS